MGNTLAIKLENVKSSIVMVYAIDFDGKEFFQGSGVILKELGVAVTNLHVLINYKSIKIVKGRREIPFGEIIGMDEENDILILSLDTSSFSSIKFGSGKFLKNGQKIYTVSNPKGVENDVIEGQILGVRREMNGNQISLGYAANKFLQFSADITHGSSGGAILNEQLELIGIIFAQTLRDKITNYAVPINDVLEIINRTQKITPALMRSSILNFQGNNAYNNKDMPSAINYFSKSLEILPDKYDVLVKRAEAYNEIKKHNLAFSDCDKAISISPESAEAFGVKGQTFQYMRDFDNCERLYLKALQIDTHLFEYIFNLSFCYYQKSNYEKAIEYIDYALDLEPLNLEAILIKGDCFFELNETNKALKMYNELLKLREGDPYLYVAIGDSFKKKSLFNESLEFYDKAIELDNRYLLAYQSKTEIFIILKNETEAWTNLNILFELFPQRFENYHERGAINLSFGYPEKALLDLLKYSTFVPPNANLYFEIGCCYHRLDHIKEAISYYDKALSLKKELIDVYVYRGYAYKKINKPLKAINDFSEHILQINNNYQVYIGRGKTYSDIKKYEKAIEDFTRAIEIDDGKAEAYCERGICYCYTCGLDKANKDLGKVNKESKVIRDLNKVHEYLTKALDDLNKALALDPKMAEAYYYRSICYFSIGLWTKGIENLEHAALLNPDYEKELRLYIIEIIQCFS